MRIKRFEAKNTTTALAMIKSEMGDDAVILATRSIGKKNGKTQMVEVVAAMDYDIEEIAMNDAEAGVAGSKSAYGYHSVRAKHRVPDSTLSSPSTTRRTLTSSVNDVARSESHDMRLRFANLLPQPPPPAEPVRLSSDLRPLTARKPVTRPDQQAVKLWRDQLIEKLHVPDANQTPKIMALVGATGVGKTTTTAKMAAWYSLRAGKRVALLSMDCYRIGATDQLRAYAKIMRLPCEIALRKKDLVAALEKHSDKDVIIIDTAGKSPYDTGHINELQEWFAPCTGLEPHLVLSATTKKEDLQTMITSYSTLSTASLILTKLDETRAYAALCQQVVASSLPISYLCTGQRVPEDFMVANKDYLDTLFKNGWDAATAFVQSQTSH
nr:flagellar biosynthesis protein FlhF [Desulfobulbaceae bacterium]